MKHRLGMFFATVLITAMTVTSTAHAGVSNGGGGKAVVCRDANRKIQSVEMLDLWEARTLYNRSIISSTDSVKDLVNQGLERSKLVALTNSGVAPQLDQSGAQLRLLLGTSTGSLIDGFGNYDPQIIRRLRGVTLTLTEDSFEDAQPENCAVEQVVTYRDLSTRDQILVNQDLIDAMDNVNQAALYLHEGLYKYLRESQGEPNSIRTRRAVGVVMSGATFTSTYELLMKPHFQCETSNGRTRIHLIPFDQKFDKNFPAPPPEVLNFGVFPEKVDSVYTMGFESFTWSWGFTLQGMKNLLDLNRPFQRADGFGAPVSIWGPIEPEFQGWIEITGKIGGQKRVIYRQDRVVQGLKTTAVEYLSCHFTSTREKSNPGEFQIFRN